MKLLAVLIAVLLSALFVAYLILYNISDYNRLSGFQRDRSESILADFEEYLGNRKPEEKAIIDYDTLLDELSFIDQILADKIFSINPAELGFKGPYYSKEKAKNLRLIESVKFRDKGETGIQYLPDHVYQDYLRMMQQMKKDIGKMLYVDSGYRSPGRQAYLFFYYLVKSNDFSLRENAKWIAMPGYSEHGHPVNTAIDFASENGINGFSNGQTAEDFVSLEEYLWLVKNAAAYNFYLSYPVGNKFGVAFEPWHWHWEKKD